VLQLIQICAGGSGLKNVEHFTSLGEKGPSASKLRSQLMKCKKYSFMPGMEDQAFPTAKIDNFFFTDGGRLACKLENLEDGKPVFIHGDVLPWAEDLPAISVGKLQVKEW